MCGRDFRFGRTLAEEATLVSYVCALRSVPRDRYPVLESSTDPIPLFYSDQEPIAAIRIRRPHLDENRIRARKDGCAEAQVRHRFRHVPEDRGSEIPQVPRNRAVLEKT